MASPAGSCRRSRSESDPAWKIKPSVLNRGLGALRSGRVETGNGSFWCLPASMPLLIGGLFTLVAVFSIEIKRIEISQETFFKTDVNSISDGLTRVAAIPLACAAVNYLIQHFRRTTFWWDPEGGNSARTCCGFDALARWPMILVTLGLARGAFSKLLNDSIARHMSYYIDDVITVICLGVYYSLLDLINGIVKGMSLEQAEINKTAPVSKMQKLVSNITRSGRPDRDAVYCFAQTNTVPAAVLSYVWWLYYVVGKVFGAAVAIAILVGVQTSGLSHFLAGGVILSVATASGFIFELGPNTLSLFRLSLNKPFYVGDLVTLNSNGAMDTSATSIMGFVENITMMYVVIRNFEMKQTWIPHKAFSEMIIQNWTRRPSKTVLLNIGISCRCPVAKVQELVKFGMKWIENSKEIQQANYRKCHITKVGNGYNIEIIFFPEIGVSHRGIRQKFLVAFMAASERMQVPFVPLQIQQNFCEEKATAPRPEVAGADDTEAPIVKAEDCQDLLPRANDFLKKGVGMGFKEFPRDQPNLEAGLLSPKASFAPGGNIPDISLPFAI
eukprot:TRINITY_DN59949_c0_g1_i1.p1 TRINITY_DN59949_c0_g1~~TRINITY_DN59949_c0_g1_i1.p1  ORF type:complete len:578 (+),score=82.30 TRINITY_DN59949_c0_g1_i1:69-1736(+)